MISYCQQLKHMWNTPAPHVKHPTLRDANKSSHASLSYGFNCLEHCIVISEEFKACTVLSSLFYLLAQSIMSMGSCLVYDHFKQAAAMQYENKYTMKAFLENE